MRFRNIEELRSSPSLFCHWKQVESKKEHKTHTKMKLKRIERGEIEGVICRVNLCRGIGCKHAKRPWQGAETAPYSPILVEEK